MKPPGVPIGGVKESGYGVEFGNYGIEEYTTIQTPKIVRKQELFSSGLRAADPNSGRFSEKSGVEAFFE